VPAGATLSEMLFEDVPETTLDCVQKKGSDHPPCFYHGLYTTMREGILAHAGVALPRKRRFENLSGYEDLKGDGLMVFEPHLIHGKPIKERF
jgi:hypothetical protein